MVASGLLVIAAVIASWVIASIPLYIAAKLVVGRKATLLRAMLASFIGFIFLVFSEFVLGLLLFPLGLILSLFVSIVILSFIYGTVFDTSIGGGFIIAVVSFFVAIILLAIFGALFGFAFSLVTPGRHALGQGMLFASLAIV